MDGSTEKLLQVNFCYEGAGNPYQNLMMILSCTSTNTPGLIWKTWMINERLAEAGGIYLFYNHNALKRYVKDTVEAKLKWQEGVANLSVKRFDTLVVDQAKLIS